MASVRKEDIPAIAQFMPEFWELVKKYWIVEESDEYWEEAINACDKIYRKYNDVFVKKMIIAYMDYLEEKYKSRKKI